MALGFIVNIECCDERTLVSVSKKTNLVTDIAAFNLQADGSCMAV
jgi:hypothetical protein